MRGGGCLTKIKHWSKDLKGAMYVGISDPVRGNGKFRGFKVGVLTGFQEAAKRPVQPEQHGQSDMRAVR